MTSHDRPRTLSRALGYPYQTPDRAFIFDPDTGAAAPWDDGAIRTDARPILALGSNASPHQLARKFAAGSGTIPVMRAQLAEYDIAHSAQFSAYGSVPATLVPMQGAQVALHITWLDKSQLAIMHATEQVGVNYDFAHLADLALDTEFGTRLDSAECYVALCGALTDHGSVLALAERPATGSTATRLDQRGIQEHCRRLVADDVALEDFIVENVTNPDLRQSRARALQAHARAFSQAGARADRP